MASAFACWDAQGRLVAANPASARVFGFEAEALQPASPHAEFARLTRQAIRQTLKPENAAQG
ncbi:MAG: PAS domain-containing protein, partial [Phenylobacterium sp.]